MCEACTAIEWLAPRRSAAAELAVQQARLHGWGACPSCAELRAEIEELEDEVRGLIELSGRDP